MTNEPELPIQGELFGWPPPERSGWYAVRFDVYGDEFVYVALWTGFEWHISGNAEAPHKHASDRYRVLAYAPIDPAKILQEAGK